MANRPIVASLLSIALAAGACLPTQALANEVSPEEDAQEEAVALCSDGSEGSAAFSGEDSTTFSGEDADAGRVALLADGDTPSMPDIPTSGTCGEHATWSLDIAKRTLTISGTGNVTDNSGWKDGVSLIKSVVIEEGITGIGARIFEGGAFSSVSLPSTLASLGEGVFSGCAALAEIDVPSAITSIPDSAFSGCVALSSVTLPASATSIGGKAFSGCVKLSELSFPAACTSIGDSAFAASGLSSLNLPASVRTIGNQAFSACSSMKTATLPSALESLGSRAFMGCASLTSVSTLGAISEVKESTFDGCTELASVSIPLSVTKIGSSAFRRCESAFSGGIVFSSSLGEIGSSAFQGCDELSSIEFEGSAPIISNSAFTQVTARAIFPEGNSTWNESVRKNYGGDLTWYVRRADGSLALATRGSDYEVIGLPANASKETTYRLNNAGYAYLITLAKPGTVRFDYAWSLPCGHNYFAISIVDDRGDQVAADSVYYSYIQEKCTLSRAVNLAAGTYRIEVTYRAGHPGEEASFLARYTADTPYSDVPADAWYHDAVLEASAAGLMTGYGDGTFGPTDSLTRAQAATVLWRYFQPTAAKNYNQNAATNRTKMADVESGCFYTEAANWAVENGVIHGVEKDGELCFDPDAKIPREQLCVMIANAASQLCGKDTEDASHEKLDEMPDAQSVPAWAANAVAWCLNEGVVNGVDENGTRYVEPAAIVDRATMAQVMVNATGNGALSR